MLNLIYVCKTCPHSQTLILKLQASLDLPSLERNLHHANPNIMKLKGKEAFRGTGLAYEEGANPVSSSE